MRHLKLFEKFEGDTFYTDTMYYLEMLVNGHEGFTMEEVIELTKKMSEIYKEQNIEYRIYHYLRDDDEGVYFLFKEEPKTPLTFGIPNKKLKLKKIPKNMEEWRIPDDDVEAYFDAIKYNL